MCSLASLKALSVPNSAEKTFMTSAVIKSCWTFTNDMAGKSLVPQDMNVLDPVCLQTIGSPATASCVRPSQDGRAGEPPSGPAGHSPGTQTPWDPLFILLLFF